MQLEKFKNINGVLSAATCALLGVHGPATGDEDDWEFDTALMLYSETDRVQALEGLVQVTKDFGDEHIFSGKLVLDSLTGASANGALPQNTVQTFTRPSGNANYPIQPGDTPLDDTFKDTRVQLNAQWTQPLSQNIRVSTGLHLSNEYDYQAIAVNGSIARDFNRRNTTLSVGVSQSLDSLSPEGGRPAPFTEMVIRNGQFSSDAAYRSAFDLTRQTGGEDSKDTTDLIFGWTQVISRRWLTQFNVGISEVSGYLTDPFKVVSLVDSQGTALRHLYEQRPDSRSKTFVFAQSKYHLQKSVIDVSYRFTTDDWDLDSHTLEGRYRMPISEHSYLQPHVRFYQQTATHFFRRYLVDGEVLPEYASADYRIGEMTATTLGLKYGRMLQGGNEFSMRFEYYQQQASGDAATGLPELEGLDLYPGVDAVVLQFSYSF